MIAGVLCKNRKDSSVCALKCSPAHWIISEFHHLAIFSHRNWSPPPRPDLRHVQVYVHGHLRRRVLARGCAALEYATLGGGAARRRGGGTHTHSLRDVRVDPHLVDLLSRGRVVFLNASVKADALIFRRTESGSVEITHVPLPGARRSPDM